MASIQRTPYVDNPHALTHCPQSDTLSANGDTAWRLPLVPKKPFLKVPTSTINVVVPAIQRLDLEVLAFDREVYASGVIRDAINEYLARPEIQAQLTDARRRYQEQSMGQSMELDDQIARLQAQVNYYEQQRQWTDKQLAEVHAELAALKRKREALPGANSTTSEGEAEHG